MRAFSISSFVATAILAGSVVAQTKLKIMPLGDSITEITCWRTLLWDDLQADGVTGNFEFVGSMTNNPQNCQGNSGWDKHHEGHSGYLAIDIANNNLAGWLANTRPDIVNFHLGTNDITQGHSTNEITAAYTKIVGLLRNKNPNVKIIIDLLIPLSYAQDKVNALNNAIPGWVSSQTTSQSPIVIADCHTGYTLSMLRDGIHPNAAGDQLMASRIHPVMLNLIKSSIGGTTTTPGGSTPTTTTPPATSTPPTGGSPMWGQCGGIGWTGPTTCAQGSCKYSNDWYSQCL